MKQKLFMLVWDMDINKGGINRVMMNRSALLNDKYDCTLLTLDFKKNYNDIKEKLKKSGRLHPKVNILNVHDYYRDYFSQSKPSKDQMNYYHTQKELYEEGFQVQDDEYSNNNCARYFKNGVYIKYKKWDKKQNLLHVDFFNPQRQRLSREAFSEEGLMYKKTFFEPQSNNPIQDLFYTIDGKCFLTKWYNPTTKKISNVFLINPLDNTIKKFASNQSFNSYWLETLCSDQPKKPIIICDGPGSTSVMLNVDSKLCYKVSAIHSNHFSDPHTYGSPIKKNHIDILNNIKKEDALIVLTETQKKDIIKQFDHSNNIHVIPHSIEPFKNKNLAKDEKLVTMIARYHPEKRIDLAILAFKNVIKKVPDAKLEIYGDGPAKESLKQLIKENHLENNVFLKGYVNNVTEVFSSSLVSLLTSKYEGFSLVIIESMMSETPVISFDIPYGPSDIIIDGENSILVENSNVEKFSEQITFLLKNPQTAIKMGEAAKKYATKNYSTKDHTKKWLKVLENLK
ncbi:glycosyltransferase [Virgibacillus sp. SK37]|uniref:glycosyltransferase n=1 Tax=Virgibacillus sp. SK37 TaxID=403957 RepID=UPI0004D18188|nr:glycosyltransferase [Virgibacillus sp. SK37]AIF44611.1 TarM [Virgibacillus sp. SK37]